MFFLFFQVPIIIPLTIFVISLYLVVAPIIDKPQVEYLYSVMFMIAGMIFYVPFVRLGYKFRIIGERHTWCALAVAAQTRQCYIIIIPYNPFTHLNLFEFFLTYIDRWTVIIQLLLQVAPTKLVLPE